jgi:hypothetical protein
MLYLETNQSTLSVLSSEEKARIPSTGRFGIEESAHCRGLDLEWVSAPLLSPTKTKERKKYDFILSRAWKYLSISNL